MSSDIRESRLKKSRLTVRGDKDQDPVAFTAVMTRARNKTNSHLGGRWVILTTKKSLYYF